MVSPGLASKPVATVLLVWPQNHSVGFPGYDLSVAPQNRQEDEDNTGHASRYSGLLRLEASRARVSQSNLKTDGGTAWMVHVASSQRSCEDEAKDRRVNATGCIGLFYPNFVVFVVFGHNGSLVISFPVNMTPMVGGEN
jgi:hypothetical protein